MIEMQVMGVALDTRTGAPIVVLNDIENRRALPIWIGSSEASAIIRKIENIKADRPMTHDLLCNMVELLGYKINKIEIHDVNAETYFANIQLIDENDNKINVDARPSDAIALAIRVKAPIFASSKVIADGTISTNTARDEQEKEEFKDFLKDLKPSDFKKLLDDNPESNQ